MINSDDRSWRVTTVLIATTGSRTRLTVAAHCDDADRLLPELHIDPRDLQANEHCLAVMTALDLDHVAQGVLDKKYDVCEVGRWLLGRNFYGVQRGDHVMPSAMLPGGDAA